MASLRAYEKQIFWALALILTLYAFCHADPLYIPTYDDSAIVMRYLVNFKTGHFFTYNIGDGPVYGISDFWHGLTTGILCWGGLSPQASLMTVAFIFSVLFFYTVLHILKYVSGRMELAILAGAAFYFSTWFLPQTLFLGLETPLHLFLVAATFLAFFQQRPRLLYLLGVATIISKLDSCFLVAGILALDLLRSWQQGDIKKTAITGLKFFVAPLLVWILAATLIFGSPIPQSFQVKFLLYPKSPHTSWFPFLDVMMAEPRTLISMLWAFGGCALIGIVAVVRRVWLMPSLIFLAAFLGTMSLYYVFDPIEKMSWYYSLPEFLLFIALVCAPFDAFRLRSMSLRIPATFLTLLIFAVILCYRFPLNRMAFAADRNWEMTFEKERMESGELANSVAPKDHPILWTGHGYPAYLFNGYVVDVAGLNFPKIWKAVKEVRHPDQATRDYLTSIGIDSGTAEWQVPWILIRDYHPNVFMLHGLLPEKLQTSLGLRLAGSFYSIDLVNCPGFRIFVQDHAKPELSHAIAINSITVTGSKSSKNDLSATGEKLQFSLPANTKRLSFGVLQGAKDFDVIIHDAKSSKEIGRCAIPANSTPPGAVHACDMSLAAPHAIQLTGTAGAVQVFEPVATEFLHPMDH